LPEATQRDRVNGGRRNALKNITSTALASVSRVRSSPRVVVLCYHSIHPKHTYASTSPEIFEDHLRWLKDTCEILHFSEVRDAVTDKGLTRTAVAITFDDGYEDNHSHALPLLARHNVPATFFITTAFADGDPALIELFRHILDCDGDEIRGMSWAQIRELRDAGMEIGSHTLSHPNLAAVSDARVTTELADSKRILEDRLGETVSSVAYPFGLPKRNFSDRTLELAARAGYRKGAVILYRNVRESDRPLSIPRIAITNDSVDSLSKKLAGGFDWLGLYQERTPRWFLNALSKNRTLVTFLTWLMVLASDGAAGPAVVAALP
jgi:peptidoglycan/xylan/chitin deacetylase (PgdA/CDA1 family)